VLGVLFCGKAKQIRLRTVNSIECGLGNTTKGITMLRARRAYEPESKRHRFLSRDPLKA
jgi:hypothetical protein